MKKAASILIHPSSLLLHPFTHGTGVVLLLAIALILGGCGSNDKKTAVVRGIVTYNGKAVPNGTISFIPVEGRSATGEIKPDGSYTLTTFRKGDGAIIGQHKVVIVAMEDMSNRLPEARNPMPPSIIPLKYTSLATSDLRADVKDEENTIVFKLEDDKKKG
jgi:hypothetical protein